MNKRINEIRKALNLTQRAFGEKIGMQQNTIALIECGRNTSRQTVDAICREFGVNKEWLLTGTGEMFAPDPQDELAALAEKYHYSPAAGLLIEKFISLPDDRREVIIKFLEDYAEALNRMKAERTAGAPDPEDMSIDEKVEEYRRQLEEEKEAAEEYGAS